MMICRVTTLGGDEEYGEEKTVASLNDVGPVKVHEMEFDSAKQVSWLLEQDGVESVEFEDDSLNGYDAHLTIICDESL